MQHAVAPLPATRNWFLAPFPFRSEEGTRGDGRKAREPNPKSEVIRIAAERGDKKVVRGEARQSLTTDGTDGHG
jgi:hypothetical protein